jgi:hypothetical protein
LVCKKNILFLSFIVFFHEVLGHAHITTQTTEEELETIAKETKDFIRSHISDEGSELFYALRLELRAFEELKDNLKGTIGRAHAKADYMDRRFGDIQKLKKKILEIKNGTNQNLQSPQERHYPIYSADSNDSEIDSEESSLSFGSRTSDFEGEDDIVTDNPLQLTHDIQPPAVKTLRKGLSVAVISGSSTSIVLAALIKFRHKIPILATHISTKTMVFAAYSLAVVGGLAVCGSTYWLMNHPHKKFIPL